ncbi:MAG: hypothetical protein KA419_05005 [Acidobacteria bacterium]|nr:hypothetical protein [Acidobacteriota bacterium]
MVLSKKPKTAGEIKSKCPKCKDVKLHTIVALKDEVVAKVKCQKCGSEHKYYPPQAEPAKKKAPAREKASRASDEKGQTPAVSTEWLNAVANVAEDGFKPYFISGVYQANDFVLHPTFGKGLVQQVLGIGKMEVLFETGPRRLVFNYRKEE